MKNTGIRRKVDHLGRISLPVELREMLHIEKKDRIEVSIEDNLILMRPYQVTGACLVTGEVSPDNKEYAPGLFLSPKGAITVLNEMKS